MYILSYIELCKTRIAQIEIGEPVNAEDRARLLSQGASDKSHLEVSSSEPHQVEHASEQQESASRRGQKRKSIEEGTSKTEHHEQYIEQEKENDIKRPGMGEYKNFLIQSVEESENIERKVASNIELCEKRIKQIEAGENINIEQEKKESIKEKDELREKLLSYEQYIIPGREKFVKHKQYIEQEEENDIKGLKMEEEYRDFLVQSVEENKKVVKQMLNDIELNKKRIEHIEIGEIVTVEEERKDRKKL